MNEEDAARALIAIAEQGSPSHATESGSFVTLVRELACEGKLQEIAEAFGVFREAHPANASYVSERIVPVVLASYLRRDIDIETTFRAWSESSARKNWAEQVKGAISSPPLFNRIIRAMREELVAVQKRLPR